MSSLLLASKLIVGGRGLAPALLRRSPTLVLDWDTRQKSRFDAVDASGRRIGVFLPRGIAVRGGDVLVGEDGSLIAVQALAQPILVVTASAASRDPALDLLRAAYHLGNRHVPLEVRADRLLLEPDHVLAALLVRMGLDVRPTSGPFEPEAGAYDSSSPPRARARAENAHTHVHMGEPGRSHMRNHEHEHEHEAGDHHRPHDR